MKGVSLQVERGSVVAMIGSGGSGKSTLLRCINLIEEPDRGHIRVGNRERRFGDSVRTKQSDRVLSAFRAATAMVFQHFNLFPHMTAIGNVMSVPSIVTPDTRRRRSPAHCSPKSPTRPTPIPRNSRAGSGNASRSPGPWR